MKYAGIGSRQTPEDILDLMRQIGSRVSLRKTTLRTGGALGADDAFARGWISHIVHPEAIGQMEMYLPWSPFNGWSEIDKAAFYLMEQPQESAFDMAAEYHPRWNYLRQGARKLHARNMHIVLGWDLDDPVDLVICWTPGAKVAGGTGQALRVALDLGIPIRNLANESHREVILDALEADDFTQLY